MHGCYGCSYIPVPWILRKQLIPLRIHGTFVYLPTFTWFICYITVGTFLPIPWDPIWVTHPHPPEAAWFVSRLCLPFGVGRPWSWSGMPQKERPTDSLTSNIPKGSYLPRSSKGCWMDDKGCKKHHPLGFKQHPLEDAGTFTIIYL